MNQESYNFIGGRSLQDGIGLSLFFFFNEETEVRRGKLIYLRLPPLVRGWLRTRSRFSEPF